MKMRDELEKIDVVILCGGRGERLRPVIGERPKVLAQIGKKAFLDILIDDILQRGFKRIILSVGYLKEQIIEHFEPKRCYSLEFCEEEVPLGTGGAIKRAQPLIKSEPFLVMNGDSICKVNFGEFYRFHIEKEGILSMVGVKPHIAQYQDYGAVRLDDSCRIRSFREKVAGGKSDLISAGIYLMRSDIFYHMPTETRFSLEYDLFPRIIDERCYGFLCESELIDIGTPERYEKTIGLLSESTPIMDEVPVEGEE